MSESIAIDVEASQPLPNWRGLAKNINFGLLYGRPAWVVQRTPQTPLLRFVEEVFEDES